MLSLRPRLLVPLLALLLALLAASAGAARLGDQQFDDRIRLAGAELTLNGLGFRAVAWLRGYAAALYLTEHAGTAQQVLASRGPKRVQMKMLLEVEAKEFTKAFEVGIRRNSTAAEHAALRARMLDFDRLMEGIGKVRKGDVIDLDYLPGRGLQLSINGQARGEAIPGEDLYAGILKIFVGEHPVDRKLKAGLLGGAPA